MQSLSLPRSHYSRDLSPKESSLCRRCQSINIETLSIQGGYVHSTLDLLKESAATCELCYTFVKSFDRKLCQWTLERYRLKVSLRLCNNKKDQFLDHRKFDYSPKCIEVGVFTKTLFTKFRMESESDDPSGDERCIHGRSMLCFTEDGDPAMDLGIPWLRKVGTHTGSSSSLKVAKQWLDQCLAVDEGGPEDGFSDQHATKSPMGSYNEDSGASPFLTERPTRLLEILGYHSSDSANPRVRLIETHGGVYRYAALSYCWGNPQGALLTTNDTIKQHFKCIKRSSLPTTINDAIDVAASLEIGYLWVDALCIIQDNIHDWKVESAKMGGIYQGGLLTIAASKSASSDEGCFSKREAPRRTVFSDYINVRSSLKSGSTSNLHFAKSIDSILKLNTGHFGADVESSPLSQRAWTYQEQVLSKRMLYLAESQLYWECDHCRLSEDNAPQAHAEREYPILTYSEPLTAEDTCAKWFGGAVKTYSKRQLTYQSDKLTAISAVARATYLNRRVAYVAGLWEDCIIQGLCWYRSSPGKKDKVVPCPSWSWASQQSGVLYDMEELDGGEMGFVQESPTLPKVLSFHVETDETNPFGGVHSGRIVLRTMVTTGQVMPGQNKSLTIGYFSRHYDKNGLIVGERSGLEEWTGWAVLDDDGNEEQEVTVAFLSDWNQPRTRWKLLLLKQASEQEQLYRRAGIGLIGQDYLNWDGRYDSRNFRKEWRREVLTII